MWTTLVSGITLAASLLTGATAHTAHGTRTVHGTRTAADNTATDAAAAVVSAPDLAGVGSLVDQTVTAQLAKDKIPGAAVVVVAGGQTVYAQGYGVADIAADAPVDPVRTEFFTGSIAKVFTATAVAQLIQQGKIDPHADVNAYLKGFQISDAFPGHPVTVEDLLTHTSGFDDDPVGAAVSDPKDVPPLGPYLADHEPSRVRPPGTLAAYDNYGAALAGYIVECVSGEPFAQYMQDHLFGPLQMDATTFQQPHPPAIETNLAKGYRPEGGGWTAESGQYGAWSPTGAGTVATATDVATFLKAQLSKDPELGAGVADLMQRQHFTMDPRLPGMAYYFEERPRDGQQILFKDGDVPGFHSDMALLPDRDIGVYVVYNGDGTNGIAGWDGKALIDRIVDKYFPTTAAASGTSGTSATPTAVKDPKLDSYAGSYRSDRISRAAITRVAGLVSSVTVSANSDGTLTTNGLSQNPDVGDQRWIPVGHGEFAEQGGQDRLVFDGHGHLATTIDPTIAYYRLAWYNSPRLHLPMLYGGAGILAVGFLAFPVLALVRRLRGLPAHPRWAQSARVLAWVSGLLATGFVVALLSMTSDSNAFTEMVLLGSPWLTLLVAVNAVLALCTVGLLAGSVAAWRLRWWRPVGRIAYSLTAAGAVSFLIVAFTYNLVWP
ncbi:beta-lactamase [Catenulispora acidiphila DSM 44928]|uniref:Beta-lactamase n=1 Tax=Catenulispora acidiphila (strain DSM 44928 / JCM 14897 / NBRC 102108 / NRRL B-24433 / ID139908) TaxID=479433 RepID=C7PZ14_CATAD|nr:serine hydrolase domain-containing protein [Catenulispora acidiphila]ACU69570.1 beta-lactamase [Catenulispora acidiphila DSM 44928]